METHQGGCLCRKLRYEVRTQPKWVTMCHCKFCQRATGGAYLVEPVFDAGDFSLFQGADTVYAHTSEGSGKQVYVHFCDTCGTKLFLTFERFAGAVGIYGGTFDDPNWFDITPENSKHIFLGVAQRGTVIPARVKTFTEHAALPDGTPVTPVIFDHPHIVPLRNV